MTKIKIKRGKETFALVYPLELLLSPTHMQSESLKASSTSERVRRLGNLKKHCGFQLGHSHSPLPSSLYSHSL